MTTLQTTVPTWAQVNESTRNYYANEWGKPPTSDDHVFEMLSLLGFQAGLTWATVLAKREGLRKAFHNFQISKVSKMTDEDVQRLLQGDCPIRNERKIRAVIGNAQAIMTYFATLPGPERKDALIKVLTDSAGPSPNVWPIYGEEQLQLLLGFFHDFKFSFTGPKVTRALVESFGLALPWLDESEA
ncbi:MAG: DNA-3-methyladenine glycosylase I [Actinomycetaceae bacterium]|nr:DNA-3-methyladenine glycosylase I [Actinomycetaceae bacterium]